MQSPKTDGEYPARNIDCEEALEAFVAKAMNEAVNSGWSESEAAHALLRLACANILALGKPNRTLQKLISAVS